MAASKNADSWAEVHRLSAIARGGRSDSDILRRGLANPEASKKAEAMTRRLLAKEPKQNLGPQRPMTRKEQRGTPNDIEAPTIYCETCATERPAKGAVKVLAGLGSYHLCAKCKPKPKKR